MFIADSLIVIGTLRCLLPGRMFIVADKVSNGLELRVCVIHTLIQRASALLHTGSFSSVWRETNTSPRWSEETFFQSDVAQNKTPTHTQLNSLTWLLVTWPPCEWEKQWINIILMYQSAPSYQGASSGDGTAAPVNMTLSNMISAQLFPSSPSDNTQLI